VPEAVWVRFVANLFVIDSEEFLTGAQSLFLFNSISPQTDTGLY
jgi:hypothetical protein